LLLALEVHPIRGVEAHELELLRGRGAQQPEEVVEDLGHEVPRWSGVEGEAAALPPPHAAAEFVAGLDQRDVVCVACEPGGGRQARDPAADDDRALLVEGHAPILPTAARARIHSFTRSGTDVRTWRSRAAGAALICSLGRPNRAAAAAVARRERDGSRAIAARATARSSAISSTTASF